MVLRVDNIPTLLRPGFEAWGQTGGLSLYASTLAMRQSLSIQIQGLEMLRRQPAIFVIWHENLMPLFLTMPSLDEHRYQVWMNPPLWYMKPVHVFLRYLGVRELCLGSTGHQGQAALADLSQRLVETGASTSMAVDGPKGPPYRLRKGCLYLARHTGFPLVPVRFHLSNGFRIPINWDRKWWPLPGARLSAHLGPSRFITAECSIDEAAQELSDVLNEPVGPLVS